MDITKIQSAGYKITYIAQPGENGPRVLVDWRSLLLPATKQAIIDAFGQTDGKAVIMATNAYLKQLAATDRTKATALAGFIDTYPLYAATVNSIYMAVDNIECTGTQYIVTNIPLGAYDVNTEVIVTGAQTNSGNGVSFLSGTQMMMNLGQFYYSGAYRYFGPSGYNKTFSANTLLKLHLSETADSYILESNNEVIYQGSRTLPTISGNLALFARIHNSTSYAKLKQKQILGTMAGQTLLLVPCYRKSDNEIGIYDAINNVFYPNSGTGTFLKGADLYPTP